MEQRQETRVFAHLSTSSLDLPTFSIALKLLLLISCFFQQLDFSFNNFALALSLCQTWILHACFVHVPTCGRSSLVHWTHDVLASFTLGWSSYSRVNAWGWERILAHLCLHTCGLHARMCYFTCDLHCIMCITILRFRCVSVCVCVCVCVSKRSEVLERRRF